jgi:hypothetical protein
MAAAFVAALALGGCGIGGADLEIDAPVLDAVGLNLSTKPKQEVDLPERQGLVMPPPSATATLPPPGERSNTAQNWPTDPDEQKKKKAQLEAEAREKYCREGDWSGKGGITEFEKTAGREQRCPSKIGEALTKTVGGGEAKAR